VVSKIGEISGHSGAIYDLEKRNNKVFSASADGYVVQWDLTTFEQDSFAVKCSTPPYSVVSDNNHLWFGLSSGDLHIVDLSTKQEVKFYQQHRSPLFSLVEVPKTDFIVCGDADGNLSVWNSKSLELVLFLPLNCGKIRKINAKSDGKLIVVHGQDEKIRIFETQHFNEIVTLPGHESGSCCSVFSDLDENKLISGGKDGLLKIWDWQAEKLLESIPAHNFAIYDLLIIDEGKTIVSASRDKSIKIWDDLTYTFKQKLENKTGGHKHSVNSLCLVNENEFLSTSDDRRIIKWQIN
jgi:WD40 repeat protein